MTDPGVVPVVVKVVLTLTVCGVTPVLLHSRPFERRR
jgi:hypothetical protein